MVWLLEKHKRFLAEREQIALLTGRVDWLSAVDWSLDAELQIVVSMDLMVNSQVRQVVLIYPKLFPDTPAYIMPRGSTERWSPHQYGPGGVLCLEWGPDNWTPNISGADLIESAYRLLASEGGPAPDPVPSRHTLSVGQRVRSELRRLVLSGDAQRTLATAQQGFGRFVAWHVFHTPKVVSVVTQIGVGDEEPKQVPDVPDGIARVSCLFSIRTPGWWRKASAAELATMMASREAALEGMRGAGLGADLLGVGDAHGVDFLLATESEIAAVHFPSKEERVDVYEVLRGSNQPRVPAEEVVLATKRAAIVGLGSIGSKVVDSLARSGLASWVIVDEDVLLPENTRRHALDWAAVGVNKTDVVRDRIRLLVPGAAIESFSIRLAGQESAQYTESVLEKIAACDIVIDATASPAVFVLLAAISKRRQRPLVWGEVFAGGVGGLLARGGVDGLDALSVRAGTFQYLEGRPPAPFKIGSRYDAVTETGEPLVTHDCDVSLLAAIMASVVIDTLVNDDAARRFRHPAYLIGYRREWIFDGPLHVQPLDITAPQPPVHAVDNDGVEQVICIVKDLIEKRRANTDPAP